MMTPIFKKGERDKVKNYRGISLMDFGYKRYAEILRRRLDDYLDENGRLSDTKMGFRRGSGTIDALYALKSVVGRKIGEERGHAFVLVVDMKRIKRDKLWRIMNQLGVDKQLRNNIRKLYKYTRCTVRMGGKSIGCYRTRIGVRQG